MEGRIYDLILGGLISDSRRDVERQAVEIIVTTNGEKSAEAVVVRKFLQWEWSEGQNKFSFEI